MYFLVGLVSCMSAVAFLILDISTYVDYVKWLSVCGLCSPFNPSPNLMKIYASFSIGFSSAGITFLIIHFKKWNESPKIMN
jgi:hypothetical protein